MESKPVYDSEHAKDGAKSSALQDALRDNELLMNERQNWYASMLALQSELVLVRDERDTLRKATDPAIENLLRVGLEKLKLEVELAAKSSALEQALRKLEIATTALRYITCVDGPWETRHMAQRALKEIDDA